MTVKEFLETNTATGFEIIPGKDIFNIFVNDAVFGIDIDTSNIPPTKLTFVTQYQIVGDTLIVDGLELNISETNMLE